jgi:hypothetical protein
MQRSMALLKHKRIELMQVHNLVDLDAHLKTLRRWKAEGKIKYIGVTHYTTSSYPDLIAIIEREKLDFVQFNYSVTTRDAEKRLLPLCADKGVAVLVNRAFEDGNLFTQVQGRALPAWAAEFGAKSWAQVFLKFVLAHPAVTCVIPATGKSATCRRQPGRGRALRCRRGIARRSSPQFSKWTFLVSSKGDQGSPARSAMGTGSFHAGARRTLTRFEGGVPFVESDRRRISAGTLVDRPVRRR